MLWGFVILVDSDLLGLKCSVAFTLCVYAELSAGRCSVLMGTPTMYVDLVRVVQEAQGAQGAQERVQADVALVAGAPITPQLARRMSAALGLRRICVRRHSTLSHHNDIAIGTIYLCDTSANPYRPIAQWAETEKTWSKYDATSSVG